jgi:hypothetical protein
MTSDVIDQAHARAQVSWSPGGAAATDLEVPVTEQLTLAAVTAVDRYLAALNEPDADRRRQLIEEAWTPNGSLTDPPIDGEGYDGLAGVGSALHEHYAGHRFERTSEVDEHHAWFRFAWSLVGPDGSEVLTGVDVGVLAADGRVGAVVGFFGELSPLP